jgi:hypothetical protein
MECDSSNIIRVAFKGHHWVRVGGLDVEEFDIGVACCGKVAFVGGDAETVDLGIGVLEGARTDAGEGFPESKAC